MFQKTSPLSMNKIHKASIIPSKMKNSEAKKKKEEKHTIDVN